jgi:anaerobic selenocysteine-containing dehydrogenase
VITTDGSAGTATEETGAASIGHLGDLTLNASFKTPAITVDGIECKTVFQLLMEIVWQPLATDSGLGTTLDDLLTYYADECGEYVTVSTIKDLATEFWAHGKKSVCNYYRGSVQHTNGTYTALALTYLNFFVGNIDRRGGMTTGGSHWHEMGGKSGTPYTFSNAFGPGGKASPSGLDISRGKAKYAETFEANTGSPPTDNDYPAERPFFPFTSNVWQEVVAGVRHGEGSDPTSTGFYQPLAIWFHMANPNYSMPGSGLATDMLTDIDPNNSSMYKVPLAITTEIVMGETSKYCDYILPDVSYLERWASPHIAPNNTITCSGVRQPVLSEPLYPDTRMAEQIYIDVAIRLGLDGVGTNGFGTDLPASRRNFNTVEDWYRKIIVNFALESEKVPKNDTEFYTIDDWNAASSNATQLDQLEDTLIDYVLARGGVFEDPDTAYADADGNSGGIIILH